MEPTQRALELAGPISQALDLISSTRQRKFEPQELSRTFRIGLVDYGGIFLVPALVKRLGAEAPDVRLVCEHMDEDTAHKLLQRAELDAAIGMILEERPTWRRTNLFRDRFSVIARKGHPTVRGAPSTDLLNAQRQIRIPVLDKIEKMSGGNEWTRAYSMVSQNILQVPFIVEQSDLVAILPRSFALLFHKHCRISVLQHAAATAASTPSIWCIRVRTTSIRRTPGSSARSLPRASRCGVRTPNSRPRMQTPGRRARDGRLPGKIQSVTEPWRSRHANNRE